MTATRPIAQDLADFALSATWAGFPERVRRETLRSHLNWAGCALGGANTDTADAAFRAIAAMGGDGAAPVLGRRETTDTVNAALLNCLTSAAHAFDDTHLATITHPTGPVAGAAWAVVHTRSLEGARVPATDLLAAIAVGLEVECRLSDAIVADGRGANLAWYMTGLTGGVGAAVAAGRLLGLDAAQMIAAIGLAAAQSSGVRSTHGSMATAYVPALACRNGLTSAFMAAAGFGCGDAVLDGRNGLFQGLSADIDAARALRGLGSEFELLNNAYKPYPCGIVIHPAIDACLALATRPGFDAATIATVDLKVHPDALRLCWRKLPERALDAQVSTFHWAAAALVHRAAGVAQSELPCVQDPRVRALQERITVTADPALADDQAVATVTLKNRKALQARIEHATGSKANPMTDAQLEAKFIALARRVLDEPHARKAYAACRALEQARDPLELFRLATP